MVGRKSGRAFRQIDAGIGGLRFAHPPYGDPRLDRRNTREERQRGAWKGRKYLRDSRSTGRLNWRHTKLLKGGLLHAKCQMGIDRRWRGDANRLRPAPPAQAAYIVTLVEQGTSVVATGSGTINLAALHNVFDSGSQPGVTAKQAEASIQPFFHVDRNAGR